jgi:hypothetical protein
MLSSTLWISVAAYWLENRNFSLDSMRVLVLPVAAVAVGLPAAFPAMPVALAGKSDWFLAHIAVSILAYSTLTIRCLPPGAGGAAESRHIPARSGRPVELVQALALDRLPALLTMEKTAVPPDRLRLHLADADGAGCPVFSRQLLDFPFKWDHRRSSPCCLAARPPPPGQPPLAGMAGADRAELHAGRVRHPLAYVGSRFVLEVVAASGSDMKYLICFVVCLWR